MNKKIFIFSIIAIGVILRFWRVASDFHFMMDEERDALIFARVFKDGHIPLIGGSIPGGLYVGPIYTWLSSIFLFLFRFDYSKLGIVAAIVSSLSLPVLYISLKKLMGDRIAIYSLIIYSFSYLIVEFNKRYWPPTFAPSFFIFILYAISIYKEKRLKSLLIIITSLAIGLQSDPSNAALLISVILYFFFVLKEKKTSLKIFLAVVLSHIPLFLFEIRHNFFLARAVLKFFSPEKEKIVPHFLNLKKLLEEIAKVLSRIIYIGTPKDTAIQFPPETALLNIRNNIPLIFLASIVLLFLLGVVFLIKKKNAGTKFLSIFLLVIFIGISAYNYFFPGYTYEWFFTIALPAFAICFAASLAKIKKEIAIFLLCLFSVLNCAFIFFGENSYSYAKKIELLKWAKNEIKNQKYSLISLGGTYFYSGYRYLADQVGLTPVKSYMDSYYEWLYPRSSAPVHPGQILVIVNYSEFENKTFWQKYSMFKEHTTTSKTIYPLEALIVDNSNGWLNTIKYDYFK